MADDVDLRDVRTWYDERGPGDHAHTVALFGGLPNGQLAVIPGTWHLVPMEKPALVNQLVLDFLEDGSVVSMLPPRRDS